MGALRSRWLAVPNERGVAHYGSFSCAQDDRKCHVERSETSVMGLGLPPVRCANSAPGADQALDLAQHVSLQEFSMSKTRFLALVVVCAALNIGIGSTVATLKLPFFLD